MRLEALKSMPGHLIRRMQQHSTALFNNLLADYDLTSVQFISLVAIAEQENLDATRLAELVHFDRATIGGVIARLEEKRLVSRVVSPADRRIKILRATPAGRAVIRSCMPKVRRAQDQILSPLEPAEIAVLTELMKRVLGLP
ncbi:MAG: MarR family transcriptional regulator [Sphingomonadaceae bacterium]|nr:MarR family transcriptional regulator [Sphingomonadaceae bacterium]